MSIEWDDSDFQREVSRLIRKAPDHVGAGLYALGLDIMRIAKRKAPVDLGRLQSSGFVTRPYDLTGDPKVLVGFGAKYAGWVHEMPGTLKGEPRSAPRKGNYWDGGEPKFLQKAIAEKASDAARIVAEQAWKSIRQGGPGIAILPSSDIPAKPKDQ